MKESNWAQIITIISVVIVIIGWFVNQSFNRKNEIAKEARNHRLEMLKSFMNLFCLLEEKNTFVEPSPPNEDGEYPHYVPKMSLWADVYVQIKIYGKKDEINLYEEIMTALVNATLDPNEIYITDKSFNVLYEKTEKLSILCTNRIRKELKLEKID
jgi:hypothetical protein